MRAFFPGNAVYEPQSVVNIVAIVWHTLLCGHSVGDYREVVAYCVADPQHSEPVLALKSGDSEVDAVGAVGSDNEVVQQVWRKHIVQPKAPEVSFEILLPGREVDGIWQVLRSSGNAVVVPRTVGTPELQFLGNIGVDPERQRRILDRSRARIRKVVEDQRISGRREVGQYVLRYRRETSSDLVIRIGGAAFDAIHGSGSRRIKYLALVDGASVARVGAHYIPWVIQGWVREVTRQFICCWNRCDSCRAEGVLQLLPGKEEEQLVFSVVELRDPDRTTESHAVVVLVVDRRIEGRADGVAGREALSLVTAVKPEVRVEHRVAEDFVTIAVVRVAATLRDKVFKTTCGAVVFG